MRNYTPAERRGMIVLALICIISVSLVFVVRNSNKTATDRDMPYYQQLLEANDSAAAKISIDTIARKEAARKAKKEKSKEKRTGKRTGKDRAKSSGKNSAKAKHQPAKPRDLSSDDERLDNRK